MTPNPDEPMNSVAERPTNRLATIAPHGMSADQIDLIKRTICKGSTNDELMLFIHQCNRTGLDPFSRQIHAVKRWNAQAGREEMSIQTGIDGLRLIADRTEKYAGNDDPVFDNEADDHPFKATVTVWKLVNGERVPFTRSARWPEFVQTKKDGTVTRFWKQMPYLMLGKVAEALALRAAFPQELSGLYTTEEMGQADNEQHKEPRQPAPVVTQPQAIEHKQLEPDSDTTAIIAEHAKRFEEAETLEELKMAFELAKRDKRIFEDDKFRLAKFKDECKAAIVAKEANGCPMPVSNTSDMSALRA